MLPFTACGIVDDDATQPHADASPDTLEASAKLDVTTEALDVFSPPDSTSDSCSANVACAQNELCNNEVDDDCDGMSDCSDPGCASHACCASTPQVEACSNELDDDCDGEIDCDDDDCAASNCCGTPAIEPESCTNDMDDDCDGKVDCHDDDCVAPCPCQSPADCAVPDSVCETRTCESGVCDVTLVLGMVAADSTPADCFSPGCSPSGQIQFLPNDSDFQSDANPCTSDMCFDGSYQVYSVPDGTACGLGLTCKKGVCTGCACAEDCPPGDECKTPTCSAGACGFDPVSVGHIVNQQIAKDCLARVCDGKGRIASLADDADLPDDGNPCTYDVCTKGQASHAKKPVGAACGTSGQTCDGNGNCG